MPTDNLPSIFAEEATFEFAQRIAKVFAGSKLVPVHFQNNLADCLIALEIAHRLHASPLAVMQQLYLIGGRPAWQAQYVIAAINSCGRFSPLRYEIGGAGEDRACYAWALDQAGERVEGPLVSIKMAHAEGWASRPGSKWKTLPELMLRYRAATFFGRLYVPDVLLGLQTVDELTDFGAEPASAKAELPPAAAILNAELASLPAATEAAPQPQAEEQWPKRAEDHSWVDSAGQVFDAALHAWNNGLGRPSVRPDGTFRARRGSRSGSAPRAEAVQSPAAPWPEVPEEGQAEAAQEPDPTRGLDQFLAVSDAIADAQSLEELEQVAEGFATLEEGHRKAAEASYERRHRQLWAEG